MSSFFHVLNRHRSRRESSHGHSSPTYDQKQDLTHPISAALAEIELALHLQDLGGIPPADETLTASLSTT